MKAVIYDQYGPPEVLHVKEVEKPVPKADEVLIKVRATTVTAADVRVRSFTVPPAFWVPARIMLGIRKPKRKILGAELAGEVEAVGESVKHVKEGDQIFTTALPYFGGYAEYTCLPARVSMAAKPANTTYEEAAAIPIGAKTALHYLEKAKIRPGHHVLVYGASGSVGTYAVQLAKYFGAKVTGVCSAVNLEWVRSLGADIVIDYTAKDWDQQLESYDIIFLAIDKCPFSICNKALAKDGVYLNVTRPLKSPVMWWTGLTTKKRIIMGEDFTGSIEDMLYLKALVEAGHLEPVIDRRYTLDQVVEAHRYVDKGHKKGNVVITIS